MSLVKNSQLAEIINRRANLVTAFVAISILFAGVRIAENPSLWWQPVLVFVVSIVVLLIFLRAKVFVKAVLSILVVLVLSSWAFRLGSLGGMSLGAGTVWMFSTLLTFFLCLSLSYIVRSQRSRWMRATFSTLLGFIVTYSIGASGADVRIASLVSIILSTAVFYFIYRGISRRKLSERFPMIYLSESLYEGASKELLDRGWGVRRIDANGYASMLIWNDSKAFMVSEIDLEEKLGFSGKEKRPYLSYLGENVNPWLDEAVSSLQSKVNGKGALPILVLLDRKSKNGPSPKTIGVSIPDSSSKIPVGVLPAKRLLDSKNYLALLESVVGEWSEFTSDLKKSQVFALDRSLPEDNESSVIGRMNQSEQSDGTVS